mgnify:CR=1 FL=1
MTRKRTGRIRELDNRPMTLAAVDIWAPSRHNQDKAELTVSTEWLLKQRCPEHPFAVYFDLVHKQWRGWTHCMARWAPVPGKRFRRPSVVFTCPPAASRPAGHLFEVVLENLQ